MATTIATPKYTAQDLVLDEGKLSAAGTTDRAELYLLEWLSTVEKAVNRLDQVSRQTKLAVSEGRRILGWRVEDGGDRLRIELSYASSHNQTPGFSRTRILIADA